MFKKLLGLILLSLTTFVFAADETETKGDDKEKAEIGVVVAGADESENAEEEKAAREYVVADEDKKDG